MIHYVFIPIIGVIGVRILILSLLLSVNLNGNYILRNWAKSDASFRKPFLDIVIFRSSFVFMHTLLTFHTSCYLFCHPYLFSPTIITITTTNFNCGHQKFNICIVDSSINPISKFFDSELTIEMIGTLNLMAVYQVDIN